MKLKNSGELYSLTEFDLRTSENIIDLPKTGDKEKYTHR